MGSTLGRNKSAPGDRNPIPSILLRASTVCPTRILPFLHSYFEERLPDCSVAMSSRPSLAIVSGVENKEYDAGLEILYPSTDRATLIPVAAEKMVFVCQ